MGDGLKYVFEIDAQTPGLEALLSKLERAEKILPKVKHDSEEAGKGHQKHGKDAEHLEGVLHRLVHAGIEPFLHKAKEIAEFEFIRRGVDKLIEAPEEIADKIKELGEEMILVAAKTERVNKSFELFFGAEKGSEVLEYLESIAGATEFTDDRLKGAAQSLAKVGFEGAGLTRALAASLDAAALSPDKEAGLGSALQTLEMVKATGRIRSETLLSLGLGPDKFFKELATRTGMGVDTVKKKLAEGKIDTNEALEALYTLITQKTGKDLGGAGVAMGKGLEARLTHLKDLPEQFFEKLADSPGLERFKDFLGSVLDELDPEGPKGQAIFKSLEGAFDTIADALKGIDVKTLSDNFVAGITAMADSIRPLMSALKGVGAFIDGLTKAADLIDTINRPWRNKTKEANEEFKKTHAVDFAVDARLKDMLRQKRENMKAGILNYGPHEDPQALRARLYAEERGKMVAAGQAKGMEGGISKVDRAGEKLGEAATDATSKALGIHSPSKVFAELGAQTAAGFAIGVESAAGMVDDVLAGAFAVPAPQGGRIAAGGPPVVVTIGDIMVNVPGGSTSSAQDIGQAVRAAVRDELLEALEGMNTEAGAR